MGRIVSNFFIALDGVVESPDQWHFSYFDDEMGRIVGEGAQTVDCFLLGRKGYDEWADYWPEHQDDGEFGTFLNNVPKYVLTHRPIEGELWNNTTVIGDDAVAQVQKLKDETERDICMSGSATTVRWLIANGLLDQLTLLVHPIAVGKGQRLFEEGQTVPLKLESSEALPSGVLHLRYSPAPAGSEGDA